MRFNALTKKISEAKESSLGISSITIERNWRDLKLLTTVDPYQKYPAAWYLLTDTEKDAVAGYRQELLAWPQHPDFPDSTKRPIKPIGYPG